MITNELRDRIVDGMCLTWRHDFGLERDESSPMSSGMTEAEREGLRLSMRQIFDHHVAPLIARIDPLVPHPLMHGRPYPASAVLGDMAGQEGCDGDPYDTMQAVADELRKGLPRT